MIDNLVTQFPYQKLQFSQEELGLIGLNQVVYSLNFLSDSEIRENLLTASVNRREFVTSGVSLYERTQPRSGDSPTTEHLARIVTDQLRVSRDVELKQCDDTSEFLVLLFVTHVVHLVRDRIEPRLAHLKGRTHLGKLETNHGLINELLSENLALHCPLIAVTHRQAHVLESDETNTPSLMIKIEHDDLESFVDSKQHILVRDEHFFKENIRSSGRSGI
jgi:hypothetical protein